MKNRPFAKQEGNPQLDARLLREMSKPTTYKILKLMVRRQRGAYVRQISNLLHVGEPHVSERLTILQRFGLVESKWKRVGKRNFKVYSLRFGSLGIEFERSGAVLRSR